MSYNGSSESDMHKLVKDLESDLIDAFNDGIRENDIKCPYCGDYIQIESSEKAICPSCGRVIPIRQQ